MMWLVLIIFMAPLVGIVIDAIATGESLCDCECHAAGRPNRKANGEFCPCGDRW